MADILPAPTSGSESTRIVESPRPTPVPSANPEPRSTAKPERAANTAVGGELSVEAIADVSALAALEPEWQELADDASETNSFYEPWMALPALRELGAEGVHFIGVFAGDPLREGGRRLVGLFPFEEVKGPLGVRYLRSWQHRYCYLGAPLVRRGQERAVVAAFFDWMSKAHSSQQLVRFDLLPADGALRRAITDEVWQRQWPQQLADSSTRAWFRPASSAEAFISTSLRTKRRKELRRLQARLGELGKIELTELLDPDDVRQWTDEFIELESRGWKGQEGVSISTREQDVRFFRELLRHAALRDRLMMLALRLDGRPIAMKLNLMSPSGGSFAMKITYDERFAKYSPGVQLELDNIQRLHQRTDVTWMDSCASPNRWMINQLWPERREFHSLVVAADRPLPSAMMTLLPAVRWLKRWVIHRAPPTARSVSEET